MTILFYRTKAEHGGFSNFSKHPVRVYGAVWPTSEHAFQAMKFSPHRSDLVRQVKYAESPKRAAEIGRDRSLPIRADWDQTPTFLRARLPDFGHPLLQSDDGLKHEEPAIQRMKDLVMYEVVYAKMTQHPELRSLLLDTKDEALVEDTTTDLYWGWGTDHTGENKLGRLLMVVRASIVQGMATGTAFGKPDRVDFVCTAGYPWKTEYGNGMHPEALSVARLGNSFEGFECPHCHYYYESQVRPT